MSRLTFLGVLLFVPFYIDAAQSSSVAEMWSKPSVYFQDADGNSAVASYRNGVSVSFGNGEYFQFIDSRVDDSAEGAIQKAVMHMFPRSGVDGVISERVKILTKTSVFKDTGDWDGYVPPLSATARVRVFNLLGQIEEDFTINGDGYFYVSPKGRYTLFISYNGLGELYRGSQLVRTFSSEIGNPIFSLNDEFIVLPSAEPVGRNQYHLRLLLRTSDNAVIAKDKILHDENFSWGSISYLSSDGNNIIVGEDLPEHTGRVVRIK